jgi:predicted ArsR family transcriptional regulator
LHRRILAALRIKPLTVWEIADVIGRSRESTRVHVVRLIRGGYIEHVDGYESFWTLTEKGSAQCSARRPWWVFW